MLEQRVEPPAVNEAPRAPHLSVSLRPLEGIVIVEKVKHQLVGGRKTRGRSCLRKGNGRGMWVESVCHDVHVLCRGRFIFYSIFIEIVCKHLHEGQGGMRMNRGYVGHPVQFR